MSLRIKSAVLENQIMELSSGARLLRGLKNASSAGLDISRGAIGLGLLGAQSTIQKATGHSKRLASEATELAKSLTTNLAGELTEESPLAVPSKKKLVRRVLCGSIILAVLSGATYAVVRKPSVPEPSPLPPTVNQKP
ncbi:MAG: cell wall synthesis protein CwsA [Mycobacteriaceae bacterium]